MAIFNVTITEAGSAATVQTVSAVFVRSRSESLSASSSLVVTRIFGGHKQDLSPAAATQSASVDYVVSVTETLSAIELQALNEKSASRQEFGDASEGQEVTQSFATRLVTEFLNPKDLVEGEVESGNSVSEILHAVDSVFAQIVPPASVLEELAAIDASVAARVFNVARAEILIATESSRQGQVDQELSEELEALDSQGATVIKAVRPRTTSRQFIRSSKRRATANFR